MKKNLIWILVLLLAVIPTFVACESEDLPEEKESAVRNVMTASVDENGAIGIGWDVENVGTSISESLAKAGLSPMIPVELTKNQTTSSVVFNTGTLMPTNGKAAFNSVKSATPALFGQESGGAFSLVNLSLSSIDAVLAQASFEAQNQTSEQLLDVVRIGIFKRERAGSGDYLLQGVLAKTAGDVVGYGAITQETDPETIAKSSARTFINLGSLAERDSALNGADQMHLVALVWLDGVAYETGHQNADVTITLTFSPAN